MKIVGLRALKGKSKAGRDLDAVIVCAVGPDGQTIGQGVLEQFVNRPLFDAAAAGQPMDKLIGKECQFGYDRRGFLSSFTIS